MPDPDSPGERLTQSLARLRSAFLDQPGTADAGETRRPGLDVSADRPGRQNDGPAARLLGWPFAQLFKAWAQWQGRTPGH
jgi:hypothetical protein